jgi:hypothetical protein
MAGLQQVEDTTKEGTDRFVLSLTFRGVDLELQLPKTCGKGGEAPEAWNKLHEALKDLAALSD